MSSNIPTRYLVHCPNHGNVFLTYEEYMEQLKQPDNKWCCPDCGENVWWDDDNYEQEEIEQLKKEE